jgi:membrane-anchored protein YejM (alkaline phosphatase superfamily)
MVKQFSTSLPIFILISFILILAGLLALYLHVAGSTSVEVILLVGFPLFADFVFHSQEENILGKLVRVLWEVWP